MNFDTYLYCPATRSFAKFHKTAFPPPPNFNFETISRRTLANLNMYILKKVCTLLKLLTNWHAIDITRALIWWGCVRHDTSFPMHVRLNAWKFKTIVEKRCCFYCHPSNLQRKWKIYLLGLCLESNEWSVIFVNYYSLSRTFPNMLNLYMKKSVNLCVQNVRRPSV